MTKFLLFSTATLFLISPAFAQEDMATDTQAATTEQSYLSFGGGFYDAFDDDTAAEFRMEYRAAHKYIWHIKPWAGIEATTDGTIWGGGGLLADIPVNDQYYIAPSFGAGLYGEGSSDKDLGHVIEFRSQIEGGVQLDSGPRLGIALSHMSNLGLDDHNPGAETVGVYFHVPVGGQ